MVVALGPQAELNGVANIPIRTEVLTKPGYRIDCAGRHKTRGGRIEDGSFLDGAAEDVGTCRAIVDRADFGEVGVVAAPLVAVGTLPFEAEALHAAETFIVAEDEDLVLDDRAAGGGAELVLAEFALLGRRCCFRTSRRRRARRCGRTPKPRRGG